MDYSSASGTAAFVAGKTEKAVAAHRDGAAEEDETLTLSNPSSGGRSATPRRPERSPRWWR